MNNFHSVLIEVLNTAHMLQFCTHTLVDAAQWAALIQIEWYAHPTNHTDFFWHSKQTEKRPQVSLLGMLTNHVSILCCFYIIATFGSLNRMLLSKLLSCK